ncbi:MAG TPA: hypothetical protein VHK05_03665 [Candidatus Limnocylindrales bacterium]|jgi:hypothetical protein|nr:hypothetical protein [Candidatus Limnocylindrales bacterium]
MARWTASLIRLGLLTLSLALVACTGSASSSPSGGVEGATLEASAPAGSDAAASGPQADAEAQACAAIQAWSDEMRALGAMDASTASIDDVRVQADEIRVAWTAIKTSLQAVEVTDEQAVMTAGEQLETAIDNFQTDVPVAEAIANVQTAAQPLKDTYQEMADGLGCTIQDPY